MKNKAFARVRRLSSGLGATVVLMTMLGLAACGGGGGDAAPAAASPSADATAGSTTAGSTTAGNTTTGGSTAAPAGPAAPTNPPAASPAAVVAKRGSLIGAPVLVKILNRSEVDRMITDNVLIVVTGAADCIVHIYQIEYNTIGSLGEPTNATAAIMVPSGNDNCDGPRPIVLYAHGTSSDRSKNMALVDDDSEASAMMAMFAAQGFVLVAPNYTGYDKSTLPYHPYLIADAQADDMVDALRAARLAIASPATPTAPINAVLSGQLFITGYSQGGYVAMATHRAIDQRYGAEFQVTASVPMSGPYALRQFEQVVISGQQNLGASLYTPLLIDALQKAYGNVYSSPGEVYAPPFDQTVPGLLPSTDSNAKSKLPSGNDGSYRTLFDTGDGSPFLLTTAFRQTALAGAGGFVQGLQRNELPGNWQPRAPVALCYGDRDPVVFGLNSTAAQTAFANQGVTVRRWNLEDGSSIPSSVNNQFRVLKETLRLTSGGGSRGDAAVTQAYHGGLVSPFCTLMARDFFRDVLTGAGGT